VGIKMDDKLYAVKQELRTYLSYYYRSSKDQKKDIIKRLDGITEGVYLFDRDLGLELWKHYFNEYVERVGNVCLKGLYELQDSFPMEVSEHNTSAQHDFYHWDFVDIRNMDDNYKPMLIEMTKSHTHMFYNKTELLSKPYRDDNYKYFIWKGGYEISWEVTDDWEVAQEFANELPIRAYNEYAQAEIYIPSVRDVWECILEGRRNKVNYKDFAVVYADEISQCINHAKGVELAQIVFDTPRNNESQTMIYFSVISKAIPKQERYNWHGDNDSQVKYNGAITLTDYDDGVHISTNH
jgi:hypothetical protein